MSHQPERTEKDCLNCGTIVQGRYCHVCGQENIVTKESFLSLVKHFIYDVLHFDKDFFATLKYLLFRPGFLSKQYLAGKRASYLNPIRMYLFTSAMFFLIVFAVKDPKTSLINVGNPADTLTTAERIESANELRETLSQKPGDVMLMNRIKRLEDTTKPVNASEIAFESRPDLLGIRSNNIKSVQQYDSLQKTLPQQNRDGWIKQRFVRKSLAIKEKYSENPREGLQDFLELFVHRLPYILFLSLPFFALILKLLYIRHKEFLYSDHAIFTLHHYIFSFIILLLILVLSILNDWLHLKPFEILINWSLISWLVYLYAALKNFYGQGWIKTFSKFLLLNLLGILVLLLLFVIFLFFTLFQL